MPLKNIFFYFFLTAFLTTNAQVVINEVVSSNSTGYTDDDGETNDWIELYNNSDNAINLDGYFLNDKNDTESVWQFPPLILEAGQHLVVFASGKDRYSPAFCYKTIITEGDSWSYLVTDNNYPNSAWRTTHFDDLAWQKGISGFGYDDNDDNTVIYPLYSIYIRKEFQINNPDDVQKILLHVDYDDAFAAFINGELVAHENLTFTNAHNLNEINVTTDHEANMYSGGKPDEFVINPGDTELLPGTNVLAIQAYNINNYSSDFTIIPFLSIGSTLFETYKTEWFINDSCTTESFHTNFKINKEGESIYLFEPDGSISDSINVPELFTNASYGRFPDGADDYFYFTLPTPQQANTDPQNEMRNPELTFSPEAGFYNGTQSISILTDISDVEIRYTTDGSEPNSESYLFTSPIRISKPTPIRAAIYRNGIQLGETTTNTYFVNVSHTLPVISLSTAPKNFFDYHEGILVEGPNAQPADPHYGANYWMDWEKEVHFELFDINGEQQIDQGAGVKITGNYSRMSDLKSMALFARSQYGKGSFDYSLFNDRGYKIFETLLLRNSGNDFGFSMLRDGYVSEVVKNLDMERLAYQPAIVYLNGEYWGILNMRDKPNEHYFKSNYNIEKEELNLLEGNASAIHGTDAEYRQLINFISNRQLNDSETYSTVAMQIDISCYIDYQLTQIFINNGDWPGNNIKYWKSNKPGSKWRWLLFDTDFGMGLYNMYKYSENTLILATATNGPDWPNPPWSTLLFRKLLTNNDFKHQFISRAADLMNTTFSSSNMTGKLDSIVAIIEPEIEGHLNKWGGWKNNWNNQINEIKTFANYRPTYMRNHFRSFFGLSQNYTVNITVSDVKSGKVKVNTITPGNYPFNGIYFSNVPVTFKALPQAGHRFVRWEGASQSEKSKIELFLNGTTNLHAVFEDVEQTDAEIVINEINYRSDDEYNSGDWIEIYNKSDFAIDLFGWKIADQNLQNGFVFPQNTIIYPGDYLVICNNTGRFSTTYPKVQNIIGDMKFGLSSEGETISLYNIENALIDQVSYLPAAPWPTAPLNTSSTLELESPGYENAMAQSWSAGLAGGTPGMQNSIYTSTRTISNLADNAQCSPSPFKQHTTLGFNSRTGEEYEISICDLSGNVLNTINGIVLFDGRQYIDIFTEHSKFSRGIYFVKIKTSTKVETIKVVKG
ncbi:MAG: CotH kinase family protein [Prolixibacteraceae bacterium]|jgi:hypothetical protein|nr:CotH kinase family protein [Prolixibacteraceae bacterium]